MGLFLDGRSLAQRLKGAEELLLEHGYLVRGPLIEKHEVKNPAQLVRFFYDALARYNPQFKMVYAGNVKKDRAIAKKFIEVRIELGSSKARAITECCEFILLLFRYEQFLSLSFPITSMGVLGQESMAWVTERLWQIHEGLNAEVNAAEEARWRSRLYAEQEKERATDDDILTEAKKHMEKVLKRHGKKEE